MTERTIIGGVAQNNHVTWLHEDMDNGIDIAYEEHCCDCLGENGYHDSCWCTDGSETILVGFKPCAPDDPEAWFAYVGEHGSFAYKPDPEAEYSAIVGEIYSQVVRSRWVSWCALCSPCYPGQGDLDTPGQYLTYALPSSLYDEEEEPLPIEPLD